MTHSKWSISTNGEFFYNNRYFKHRAIRIVHVDDHIIFVRGLRMGILPFFPRCEIININDGNKALEYIEEQIKDKIHIDLIITDINHPGLKGDKLVQQLRLFEEEKGLKQIPIIVLTMVGPEYLPHISNPACKMVDRYFSKCIDPEDIVDAIEDILYCP